MSAETPVKTSLMETWHSLTAEESLAALQANPVGLTSDDVATRLSEYGPNTIVSGGGIRIWAIILRQFTSPLIYVLLIVMVVTLFLREWADAAVIGAVVLLNAVVGFTQEHRAENAMQALMRMIAAIAQMVGLSEGKPEVHTGPELEAIPLMSSIKRYAQFQCSPGLALHRSCR